MATDAPRSRPRRRRALVAALAAIAVLAGLITTEVVTLRPGEAASAPVLAGGCHSAAPQLRVLLVGNSYTYANDLPKVLAHVMCRSGIATNLDVRALVSGSATMRDWVLNGAADKFAGHDVVVLQEQSEIPGFDADDSLYRDSLSAIDELAGAATTAHARVVLYETWGRHDGDPLNPMLYPDYETMQARLSLGYAEYLESIRAGAAPDATIAAVGDAWSRVRTAAPGLWDQLYSADASHPSAVGTYLVALVLAEAVSRHELPTRTWKPANVTAAQAAELRAAAVNS